LRNPDGMETGDLCKIADFTGWTKTRL
jgi:hypothetical protein